MALGSRELGVAAVSKSIKWGGVLVFYAIFYYGFITERSRRPAE